MNRQQAEVNTAARGSYSQGLPKQQKPPKPAPTRLPYGFRADPIALDGLGLGRTSRALFVAILDDAKSKGMKSRKRNQTLATTLGCSIPTVKRCLADLEGRGLIRRETIAGGRIRLAIHVTWNGVDQNQSSERRTVDQDRSTVDQNRSRGVDHSRSTSQSSVPQSVANQTGSALASEGKDQPPDGKAAADYLRQCVKAARLGMEMPAPPIGVAATKGVRKVDSLPPTPQPSQDATRIVVGRMIGDLAAGFTLAELRPRGRHRRKM